MRERGLAASLIRDGLLVEHEELGVNAALSADAVAVIRPRELPVISYPYEWSFSQLREAALLTLELQRRALEVGMRLRDASAYNVQFDGGRPILIDSLSFEVADPADPWPAYRQFCEHFLGPLALVAYRDARFGLMLREFIDGIPLDLTSRILPGRTRLRPGLLAHLHLHASAQQSSGARAGSRSPRRMTRLQHDALVDSLRRAVESLRWKPAGAWVGYDRQTSYSARAAESKGSIVSRMLDAAGGSVVWDLGANVGTYSDLAAAGGRHVLAFDRDAGTVERHWLGLSAGLRASVLPLVMDLNNPSPSLGWGLAERRSILERGPADVIMALALIHHLAIGNNVPLPSVMELFARMGRRAIVEFVPKEDPMVQQLLVARPDIFPGYTLDGFRAAAGPHFTVVDEAAVDDSHRRIVLLERR